METALACVPADLRFDVLRKLTDEETERRKHPFLIGWKKRWYAVDEATSVIVQVLVRDIANCHSKADAAAVLFRHKANLDRSARAAKAALRRKV
jgi:hypothetical protein